MYSEDLVYTSLQFHLSDSLDSPAKTVVKFSVSLIVRKPTDWPTLSFVFPE